MANSFTLLWSQERCERMEKAGQASKPLTVLFGGPHQSEPRFRRFGVQPGDYLYPLRVAGGVLYVLGRMRVRQLLSVEEYVANNAEIFAGFESDWGAEGTFGNWLTKHPE